MAKKAVVNADLCIGCGACVATCPDAFVLNDEGKAEVSGPADDAAIDEAIASCPAGAIEA